MGASSLVTNLDSVAWAAANTARPTTAALGANITHSGDWTELANYLQDAEMPVTFRDERVTVDPPQEQVAIKDIIIKNGVESFDVPIEEIGANAWLIDSTASIGSSTDVTFNVGTPTYYAILVCLNGVGMFYFPNCFVKLMDPGMQITDTVKSMLHCEPRKGSSVNAGVQYFEYDGT